MQWYFNVYQNEVLIEVQIRPTEELSSGFISARKFIGFEPYGVEPATVGFNLYLGDSDLSLERANLIIAWLQVARRLAQQLDQHVLTTKDFEAKYEVKLGVGDLPLLNKVEEDEANDNP